MAATLEITTLSSQQTQALARAVSDSLQAGDIIVLTGDLGAGKTCFVQGLAAGLGVKEQVNSPTFTIMRIFSGRLPLYHFDIYRLDSLEQFEAIGYEDYFFNSGVTVIEWGDKAAKLLPEDYLTIEFHRSLSEEKRILRVIPHGRRGVTLTAVIGELSRNLKLEVKNFDDPDAFRSLSKYS